eukprot:4524820-Prymnesium_polylepis.1
MSGRPQGSVSTSSAYQLVTSQLPRTSSSSTRPLALPARRGEGRGAPPLPSGLVRAVWDVGGARWP